LAPVAGFAEVVVASAMSVPMVQIGDPVIEAENSHGRVRIWACAPADLAAAIIQALGGGA